METACQLSYPLNSENASPPGTFTLYLSWDVSTGPATTTTEKAREAQLLSAPKYFSAACIANSSKRRIEGEGPQRLDEPSWIATVLDVRLYCTLVSVRKRGTRS